MQIHHLLPGQFRRGNAFQALGVCVGVAFFHFGGCGSGGWVRMGGIATRGSCACNHAVELLFFRGLRKFDGGFMLVVITLVLRVRCHLRVVHHFHQRLGLLPPLECFRGRDDGQHQLQHATRFVELGLALRVVHFVRELQVQPVHFGLGEQDAVLRHVQVDSRDAVQPGQLHAHHQRSGQRVVQFGASVGGAVPRLLQIQRSTMHHLVLRLHQPHLRLGFWLFEIEVESAPGGLCCCLLLFRFLGHLHFFP
mmetsp:Transcript_7659/g.14403  ORF Transcript_7659/g.14403 Transcript_7659/m.14403 type:complete len:251 (-) Transcript_7659:10-762(-)